MFFILQGMLFLLVWSSLIRIPRHPDANLWEHAVIISLYFEGTNVSRLMRPDSKFIFKISSLSILLKLSYIIYIATAMSIRFLVRFYA